MANKISVIVPVYNTKQYLRECFDSILNQSLSDLELLIVDDGSDDGSWDVIEEYTARFSNVFSFKQNRKRQGAARNLALKYARGEFVAFADSDDTVPVNAYKLMYDLAVKNSSDMTVGMLHSFNEKISWLGVPVHEQEFTEIRPVTTIFKFPELLTDISPCNRLLRRSSISQYQIKFSEKTSGEDLDFMSRFFLRVERISILPEVVYNYRARADASTKRLEHAFFRDRVAVTQNLKQYFSEYGGKGIFPYLLRSEARKLVRNRLPRAINELQYGELMQVFDTIHVLAEQLTEYDILQSGDFPIEGQIRIIFIKYKQYDALIAFENYSETINFKALISDKHCQDLLIAPLALMAAKKSKKTVFKNGIRVVLRKGLISFAITIKHQLSRFNRANVARAYALLRFFALYPVLPFFQKSTGEQGIWLMNERSSDSAEDNAYHLFVYLRKNYPELAVFYVISQSARQRENIASLGNVVDLFSWRHLLLLHRANVFLSTDSFKMLTYPYEIFPALRRKTLNVFLQHGITAIKRNSYTKKKYPYFNHIIVSSDAEHKILVNESGFSDDEVVVTGMARFDQLEANFQKPEGKMTILVMPTWRKWLQSPELIHLSQYVAFWSSLITSPQLHSVLERYNAELLFRPHFNMLPFISDFNERHERIKIISEPELNVQSLIKNSDMVVTDYSSVLFDFLYQGKPAICYIFDNKAMESVHGKPYVDYNDLPVGIAQSEEELISEIVSLLEKNCQIDDSIKPEIEHYIKFRDHHNCERVYQSVLRTLK